MFGKNKEYKLKITGMSCSHCVSRTEAALRSVKGVKKVSVDLASGAALVTAAASVQPEALTSAVTDAGYGAELL